MDIIVTLPKTIKWEDYQKEIDRAENIGEIMNFKVSSIPAKIILNKSKCYITHNGLVKGYMIITGISEKDFKCSTTGNLWKGKFIERSGKFFPVKEIQYKGFQGYRYFDYDLHKNTLI